MTYCTTFVPKHQAQLGPDGGQYGSANCTASSAGMAAQAHTCGKSYYSGATIRAATNEPIPDPASPGLNLSQVHAALIRLSGGAIDLDCRYGYDFAAYRSRLVTGAQAVLQGRRRVLVEHGQAYGNLFAGGHAIHTYVKAGVPWFDDPLTGPHATTWEVLRLFAGSLVINSGGDIVGFGRVYAMFTRDITATWTAHATAGTRFVRHYVSAGVETSTVKKITKAGFTLPCSAPVLIRRVDGTKVPLVQITKAGSSMDGWWISADKYSREVP